jgi:hypothetical protein
MNAPARIKAARILRTPEQPIHGGIERQIVERLGAEAEIPEGVEASLRQLCLKVFSRVVVVGECWEFQGARQESGYGRLSSRIDGRQRGFNAHRVVCEAFHGMPEGYFGCHKCDNPPCCRPSHLFPGTQKDNIRDCIGKGRNFPPPVKNWAPIVARGEHHWQVLTDDQVRQIKNRLMDGEAQVSIAKDFDVSFQQISKIAKGDRWAHQATEFDIHRGIVQLLRVSTPKTLVWYAIPNGRKRSITEGKKLKAEGVRPGAADLAFVLPDGTAAFMEIKTKGGRQSPEQREFEAAVSLAGARYAIVRSIDEARAILASWGALKGREAA